MFDWNQYVKQTKEKKPRQLLCDALSFVKNKDVALDLGAGALNDSKYLLEQGFLKVIAVDQIENKEILSNISDKRLLFKKEDIRDFSFSQDEFDLINAQFVLFFLNKESIKKIFFEIKKALSEDGIFVGQLLGLRDSWSNILGVTLLTKEEVEELLSDFEVIHFLEEENDKEVVDGGLKHWHIFHFIVKK